MRKKPLFVLLLLVAFMTVPFVANAATIPSSSFDEEAYLQGQTGYITVGIFNDEDDEIRVTELTATINYYYTDANVYLQTFFTNATLPIQVQQGQTGTFYIPFSLPSNIASGYTNVQVKAETELWYNETGRWFGSDHPTYQLKLFIESPFKQQLEEEQATNEELQTANQQLETSNQQLETANQQMQNQLNEQQTINAYNTNMMYILGATVFAAVIGFIFVLLRKTRTIARAAAQ